MLLGCPPGFEAAGGYSRACRGADVGGSGTSRSQAVRNRGQNPECLSCLRLVLAFWSSGTPCEQSRHCCHGERVTEGVNC